MAEELHNNNNFNNLILARSIGPGTILLGIADEELQIGDRVTFEQNEILEYHLRKLTPEEVLLITNGEITSDHTINRVERVARVRHHADIGDVIEFIIEMCCDYVIAQDPYNAVNVFGGLTSSVKKHEMDEDYPHECFNPKCKKDLKYLEAWKEIKKTGMTEEKFKYLWELEEVEFYCCACYNKEMRKQNPNQHSRSYMAFSTPRHFGGDALDTIREAMRTASRRWSMFPSSAIESIETIPTVLFPNPLHALQNIARSRFGPPPVILPTLSSHPPIRNIQQFRIEIRIIGASEENIRCSHNIVISVGSHDRLNGIPDPLDFTMIAPQIHTHGLARMTAELIFHWISAKVLLHPENEEWIPLEQQEDIIPSINYFIDRMTRAEGIIGPDALDRFMEVFPNFPHMWNHNNESCDFCGLSLIQVYEWSYAGMGARMADYRERVLWNGYGHILHPDSHIISGAEQNERSYLESMGQNSGVIGHRADEILVDEVPELPYSEGIIYAPHEHILDGDMNCQICRRSMVDIDAERSRRSRGLRR